MSRHTPPPVALSPGRPHSRTAHSRGLITRRRAPTYEKIRPGDIDLGELFVHTRDAVVVGNVDSGSIVLWNPAAERIFGWTAAEAIGQPLEILIPPTIARLHQQGLAFYRRTGHGSLIDSGSAIEVPARRRDGEDVRVELTLASVGTGEAASKYVMAMFRDVSVRRRAALQAIETARLEASRNDLERTLGEQQHAFQTSADELERELVRVRRVAQQLTRALDAPVPDDPKRIRQRAQVIALRAERARRAVDEISTSVGMQAGSIQLKPERVNLVPLVMRVVADVRARSTPCKVNVAMPQGLTAVVDPLRIEQVVRTLVDRAMRRNPRGCWVDVDLRRPLAGQAQLEVRDVGRPISATARERLVDPTGRGDRGLALCRSIVKQHGGTLGVEFPPDGGVRVLVTLPTQRARASGG